jgi:ABC-type glycerol-3-phosphate transport system permease component
VGCGKGSYHPLLIARGVRAILGVDASPAMVAATQRQANTLGLPVVSIEGNAERLPVGNFPNFYATDQALLFAGLAIVMVPPLTVFAVLQRSSIQGLTVGSLRD